MTTTGRNHQEGIGLVEVIGALAIITILAVLLFPRIQRVVSRQGIGGKEAANDARTTAVLANVEALRTAVLQHQAQFGSLASRNGEPLAVGGSLDGYDRVLISEGIMDRPFSASLGASANVRLVDVSRLSSASPVSTTDGAYDLSGVGRNEMVARKFVAEVVVKGVTLVEAATVNESIDGSPLSSNDGSDVRGRVVVRPVAPGSACDVRIYVAHQ